ncbi:hypothetical protein GPUN_2504 [Glaciecola punicea ACAM 611]|uniref:Uncharacterized protein n=1 Tax=Glaciecola punicea ACAM 611 TaxID=1121923 RepID=H5TE92_9ALTE|nr:hypothetical protein GPUN_2504 [Glaciecola punicea ACAM 611]
MPTKTFEAMENCYSGIWANSQYAGVVSAGEDPLIFAEL